MAVLVEKHDVAGRLENLEAGLQVDARRALHEPTRHRIEILDLVPGRYGRGQQKVVLLLRPRLVRDQAIGGSTIGFAGGGPLTGDAVCSRAVLLASFQAVGRDVVALSPIALRSSGWPSLVAGGAQSPADSRAPHSASTRRTVRSAFAVKTSHRLLLQALRARHGIRASNA